jgi:peptide/nickel transport system substrate-binding protein
VTFSRSDGDWRSLFSPLLPAHYLRTAGWDSGFANNIPVTAGPFRVSQVSTSAITLVKDPNYFGTKAHLDKINFRVLPDFNAAVAAIAAGELDAYYADPATTIVPSSATVVDGAYYTQLTFNLRKKALKNANVRKAIALALNRDVIARTASPATGQSNEVAANNLFAAGSHGGTKNDGAYAHQDLARAKQLLTSAGYGSKPLTLRLVTTNNDPRRIAAAQIIARQLSAVGVHLTVIQEPGNAFFNVILPQHNFDLAIFGWSYSSTASSAADLYGCHGSQNYAGYCSSNFDRLTAQSLDQPDLDRHNQLLNKADHQLWTDLPAIPLYQSKALVAVSPKVHGATYNLGEFTLYWDTASWTKS